MRGSERLEFARSIECGTSDGVAWSAQALLAAHRLFEAAVAQTWRVRQRQRFAEQDVTGFGF